MPTSAGYTPTESSQETTTLEKPRIPACAHKYVLPGRTTRPVDTPVEFTGLLG